MAKGVDLSKFEKERQERQAFKDEMHRLKSGEMGVALEEERVRVDTARIRMLAERKERHDKLLPPKPLTVQEENKVINNKNNVC